MFATSKKINDITEEYNDKGFKCHGIIVDIGNDNERKSAFQEALKLLGGRLDILVAAGVQRRHKARNFLGRLESCYQCESYSCFSLCQMAANEMIKSNKGKSLMLRQC